jgi:predicted nucleotidyltransferase
LLAPPVPFDDLWASAAVISIGGQEVRVASIEHMIVMKTMAGRAQDLADIERLRAKLGAGR